MRLSTLMIALAMLHIAAAPAAFGAYCSLRDPVAAIQALYQSSNKYRSIVAPITEQHRQSVKQRLPFTLHRSEIGKHTLYMVFDGNRPIGFVQARSELAEWGLIEIGWGINFDMTINGLFFFNGAEVPTVTRRLARNSAPCCQESHLSKSVNYSIRMAHS